MVDMDVMVLDEACRFEKSALGDWIDLRCAEDVVMSSGEYRNIPLGIAACLPPGYEAWVLPRSSTFSKWGLLMANSMGVIDNCYRGQWHFAAVATHPVTIPKGTRICQFRLAVSQPRILVNEVGELPASERGDGGFGSTGVD